MHIKALALGGAFLPGLGKQSDNISVGIYDFDLPDSIPSFFTEWNSDDFSGDLKIDLWGQYIAIFIKDVP